MSPHGPSLHTAVIRVVGHAATAARGTNGVPDPAHGVATMKPTAIPPKTTGGAGARAPAHRDAAPATAAQTEAQRPRVGAGPDTEGPPARPARLVRLAQSAVPADPALPAVARARSEDLFAGLRGLPIHEDRAPGHSLSERAGRDREPLVADRWGSRPSAPVADRWASLPAAPGVDGERGRAAGPAQPAATGGAPALPQRQRSQSPPPDRSAEPG